MLDSVLSLHFPQYYCLLALTTAPASHRLVISLVVWGGVFPLLSGLQWYGNLDFLNFKFRSPNPRFRV